MPALVAPGPEVRLKDPPLNPYPNPGADGGSVTTVLLW